MTWTSWMRFRYGWYGWLGLLAARCLVAPDAFAQTTPTPLPNPALVFPAGAVEVQGMTPGGTVIWFAAARDVQEYAAIQSITAQVGVADATGQAILTPAAPVSPLSIWIAVDYKTGAYALSSASAGFPLQQFGVDSSALSVGSAATPDFLLETGDRIYVLLVRPGHGAWTKTVGRGGVSDESSAGDASLRLRLGHLDVLLKSGDAAPDKASPKDLIFVIRPRTMEVGTLTVGAQP
jgi:hypothetical protein